MEPSLRVLLQTKSKCARWSGLVVDDFPITQRMPSRAAAVRELFRIGLANKGLTVAAVDKRKSSDFGVIAPKGIGSKSAGSR